MVVGTRGISSERRACTVEGNEMGAFGGGQLEQLRPWLGSLWLGLCPGRAEPRGAARRARGAAGAEFGRCQAGTLTLLSRGSTPSVTSRSFK